MRMQTLTFVCLTALLAGCGENVYDPSNPERVNPPRNLEALSLDSASIGLQWQAPGDVPDSIIRMYRIEYNGLEDSVPRNQTSKTLRNLPLGRTTFAVLTVLRNGVVSDPATFTWAPAARYDTPPIIIYEDPGTDGSRPQGMHIGSRTSGPYAVPITISAAPVLHLVLQGSGAQALRLQSATYAFQAAGLTLFSTTSHAATNLDYYLSSYPAVYDRDEVVIIDNTIYYVRLRGDIGEINYARLHVRITPGAAFPNRSVEIRVSLQRSPELQIAGLGRTPERSLPAAPLAMIPGTR